MFDYGNGNSDDNDNDNDNETGILTAPRDPGSIPFFVNRKARIMSDIPDDIKYTPSHEWVRDNGDGTVTVGISDHAQEALGDLVFVEFPEIGSRVKTEESCGVVESVKAASDIYSPLDGEVIEVNDVLSEAPETINRDPYGEGWLFKLRVADPSQVDALLDGPSYEAVIAEES